MKRKPFIYIVNRMLAIEFPYASKLTRHFYHGKIPLETCLSNAHFA